MKRKLHKRIVASRKNSVCVSARLDDLDWSDWRMSSLVGVTVLHVLHRDGETRHRVFPRHVSPVQLTMIAGRLTWLWLD